jgi:hypothetical protein
MIERDKQNELYTQAFKRIFLTDDGKVLMKFLEGFCNVRRSTFTPNKTIPLGNNVRVIMDGKTLALAMQTGEGKRSVYLEIMYYVNEEYLRKEENE